MNESVTHMTETAPQPSGGADLERELHALTLNQALVDFEIANARVRDLTERLIEAGEQFRALKAETAALQVAFAELETLHHAMRSSQAFKLADRIWSIRNALKI